MADMSCLSRESGNQSDSSPERAAESQCAGWVGSNFFRPFGALVLWGVRFRGLTPPAKSCRPFGADTNRTRRSESLHSNIVLLVIVLSFTSCVFAADGQSTTARINPLAFHQADTNEFTFDTTVLRGKLHAGGKPMGLTNVVHIPSGRRLDGGAGILSLYRVFTANKRYGTAAWDWPNGKATRLPDGAVEYGWPATDDRPFEFKAIYLWKNPTTLDVEITVTARAEVKGFESFLASYFAKEFTAPFAYVGRKSNSDMSGFLVASKDAGDWQMFPRDEKSAPLIQDGRWKIEPNLGDSSDAGGAAGCPPRRPEQAGCDSHGSATGLLCGGDAV
jgi:hypothetical protein